MMIGPKHYGWVDTRTIGVPSGGPFGDVRWFEREAARDGMKLAWSCNLKCFVIYTQDGPNVVHQMNCQKTLGADPIPLSRSLLGKLVSLRRDHFYRKKGSLQEQLRQLEIDTKQKHRDGIRQEMLEMNDELIRESEIAVGKRERAIYVGA